MQLGLWASPPFLQTLGPWFPNEIQNLLSSEKRTLDHWATVQFFSLAQVRPLMLSVVQEWLNKRNTTTVAKFLDTSVCGGSWCLDPSLSPFLLKFTQILESILLDNPHKAAVLSIGCASFLPHFFLPINFLLTCLDTALCEQPALWQWMFVTYPPCEGCQWLSSGQLSDQQSSPWLCSLVNQTERPFWRLRKPLQVFWVD